MDFDIVSIALALYDSRVVWVTLGVLSLFTAYIDPRRRLFWGIKGFVIIMWGVGYSSQSTTTLPLLLGATLPFFWAYLVYECVKEWRYVQIKKKPQRRFSILEDDGADRETLDRLPVGVIRLSTQFRIEYVNSTLATQIGYEADELTGKHINDVVPERFHEGHETKIFDKINDDSGPSGWRKVVAKSKDGEDVLLSLNVDSLIVYSLEGLETRKGIGVTEPRK